jgi:hypothetical protein
MPLRVKLTRITSPMASRHARVREQGRIIARVATEPRCDGRAWLRPLPRASEPLKC